MGNNDREEVAAAVIETLKGLLADRPDIYPNTDPIKDLGLESVDGVLLAPRVAKKLGIQIPDRENLLVDARSKSRTVSEIVDVVMELSRTQQEKIAE